MSKTVHILVTGKVQGVFYRASTQKTANALHIDGWVKNLPDGTVEITARGEDQQLEQFIAWCRKGPTFAKVAEVNVTELAPTTLAPVFNIV